MTVVAKPLLPVNLHIGGKQISQGSAGVFQHVYAHSGEIQAEIPLAGRQEMNEAVEVAAKAFQEWRRWKPADRRDILLSLGNLIASKADEFGRLVCLDNGTPISLSSTPRYTRSIPASRRRRRLRSRVAGSSRWEAAKRSGDLSAKRPRCTTPSR